MPRFASHLVGYQRLLHLVEQHRTSGAVSVADVERAIPESATPGEIEDALAFLAEHQVTVVPEAAERSPTSSADDPVPGWRRLLSTPFALSRLLAARGTSQATRVFAPGVTPADMVAPLERLEELVSTAQSLRRSLATKKLRESVRRDLRRDIEASENAIETVLRGIPLAGNWIRSTLSALRAAAERAEKLEASLDACEAEVAVPVRELRRLFRDSRGDPAGRTRLCKRVRLSPQALERLETELDASWRRRERLHAETGMSSQELLRLLPELSRWEPARLQGVLSGWEPPASPAERPRQTVMPARATTGAVALRELRDVEVHALEIASRLSPSTSLPVTGRSARVTDRVRPAVAFAPSRDGEQPPPSTDDIPATYSDLGRTGEAIVAAFMRARWESAAAAEPETVRGMIHRIARAYWKLAPPSTSELAAILAESPESWLSHRLVQDLIWPARTPYGDRMGFDLFGLAESRQEILCVEVKTTRGPASIPFELTGNEYARAKQEGARYVIARVSRVLSDPPIVHFWSDPADLVERGALILAPSAFVVSMGAPTRPEPAGPGA